MVCNEENWLFFIFNTDSRIGLCARVHYLILFRESSCLTTQGIKPYILSTLFQKSKGFALRVNLLLCADAAEQGSSTLEKIRGCLE